MSALCAHGVSVALGGSTILHDVDLTLHASEVLGLVGPNGAGKSTLVGTLAGLHQAAAGEVRIGGRALASIPRPERAQRLALLPQGLECHWPLAVREVVALGRLAYQRPWSRRTGADEQAIGRAMAYTDTAHLGERTMDTLSSGERARSLLARALAGEPDVLLADEPAAQLDPAHQLDVMVLLRKLARAGAAILVVLHDLTLAARYCDRLVLLKDGRIAASGPPSSVLTPANLSACFAIRAAQVRTDDGDFLVPVERITEPS